MNDEFSRLKTIFDNAPLGVFLTTPEGKFVNLNIQLARVLGYNSVEEIIESIDELSKDLYVTPEDRQRILKETKGKNEITTFEIKFKKKNKEIIDVRLSLRPYKNPADKKNYLIGIAEDITAQKKLIEEVKISESKYRGLFENSNDAIYIVHPGNSLEFNSKARQIFDLPEYLSSFKMEDISPEYQPDGQLSSEKANFYLQKTLAGEPQKFEWFGRTFKGRNIYCEVSMSKLEMGNNFSLMVVVRDITQKKAADLKLVESERKYRSLFEESNDAIFIVYKNNIIEFNNKARKVFEIPHEKSQISFDDLHVEKQSNGELSKILVPEYFQKAIEGNLHKFEWSLKTFTGKELNCEISLNTFELEEKKYMLAIIRDITARKKAEQSLIKSEERYRNLVDNAPIGIVRTKIDGDIVFINNKLIEMLGFNTYDDAIGTFPKMQSVYKNTKDRDFVISELEKGKVLNSRIYIKGKNNKEHLINFIASPEFNCEGKVEYINSIVEDIEEKDRLEKEITRREETLSSVVNSLPFELMVTDKNDTLILQNSLSKILYGDHEGGKINFLIPHEETKEVWLAQLEEVFNQKVIDYEKPSVRPNQSFLRIIKAPLIINDKVSGIISMSIDISERKKLQQEVEKHRDNLEELVKKRTSEVRELNHKLLNTNEELYAANDILSIQKLELEKLIEELKQTQNQLILSEKMASIGVLTAGIAHEINNPINFISSGLTGLELIINDVLKIITECSLDTQENIVIDKATEARKVSKAMESIPKLIESMRIGITRTTEIVKGLRTFSRLDTENKTPSNINELIDSALIILKNKYKHRIKIVKNYNLIYPINCFPGKLSQVFLNLIVNSIQAIEDNGEITITTDKVPNKNKITISVKDDGIGIPEDLKNKIFDPFFTTKAVGEGTGLGLAIVHSIIQEHGGKIEINSEKNKGTEFKITLPEE